MALVIGGFQHHLIASTAAAVDPVATVFADHVDVIVAAAAEDEIAAEVVGDPTDGAAVFDPVGPLAAFGDIAAGTYRQAVRAMPIRNFTASS